MGKELKRLSGGEKARGGAERSSAVRAEAAARPAACASRLLGRA